MLEYSWEKEKWIEIWIGCKPKQYLYQENQVLVMKDSSQSKIKANMDFAVKLVVGTQEEGEIKCESLTRIGLHCALINSFMGKLINVGIL